MIINILQLLQRSFLTIASSSPQVLSQLRQRPDWSSKLDFFIKLMPEDSTHGKTYQTQLADAGYKRICSILKYKEPKYKSFGGKITLIRPTEQALPTAEDYGLGDVSRLRFYSTI